VSMVVPYFIAVRLGVQALSSEIEDSFDKLGECERCMAVMLDVPDANSKFECMVLELSLSHTLKLSAMVPKCLLL
jgi:hypothetical protein